MTSDDPFNLERFVTAQAPVFETVLAELRAGRKRTHWMWFVFPQLIGLGRSSTARFYGIGSGKDSISAPGPCLRATVHPFMRFSARPTI